MDGAPYLKKVELKMYKGYRELREELEAMFLFLIGSVDAPGVNPSHFDVTYENKDDDLMLVTSDLSSGGLLLPCVSWCCQVLAEVLAGRAGRGVNGAQHLFDEIPQRR
jgi:hypothetical protein